MKKGSMVPVFIIAWLIILLIILMSKFGPLNIKRGFSDFFDTVFGERNLFEDDVPGQQESSVGEIPTGTFQELTLSSDPTDAKRQLVDVAYFCWQRMMSTPQNVHVCAHVNPAGGNSKDEIIESLKYRDPDASSSLEARWFIPEFINSYIGDFFVCAQRGGVLSFTYDVRVCGGSGGIPIQRQFLLSDNQEAANIIAASLARCWFLSKATTVDYVCDTFNARNLRGTVTKQAVLGLVRHYAPEAISALDDWWEPLGDAKFATTITSNTPEFYSCASDFGEVTSSDSCLTHNKENDCCT